MKRYLALLGNIFLILFGLVGLKTPYITDGIISIGIGGILDSALLQPIFIGLLIIAIIGQFYKVRESLIIWPIIAQVVIGIVAYIFIFPVQILIIGYISLAGVLFILLWPIIKKRINKKKIVKIQA